MTEEGNKVETHITDIQINQEGKIISKEEDNLIAEQGEDGLIHEHERDTIIRDGQTEEVTRTVVENEEGDILLEETEYKDAEGHTHTHKVTHVEIDGDAGVTVEHNVEYDENGEVVKE